MIYTVTCNPSLDYIVSVEDFRTGITNRTDFEQILPGGKGINVSMVLRSLGIDNVALGFAAGFTGAELIRRLKGAGVKSDFILLPEGVSRINVKLRSIEGTEINGQGPVIGTEGAAQLLDKLECLREGDLLVLAGSIPGSLPEDFYERILERLKERRVLAVVDAEKSLLANALKHHPFLVKPNSDELAGLFGVKPGTREEAIPYARKLQEMGAANVLVSMAAEGAVLAAADGRIYTSPAPEGKLISGVGAGDSMVAGFLAGWIKEKDFRHAFDLGLAAGSATAFSEWLATGEEIERVYQQYREADDP